MKNFLTVLLISFFVCSILYAQQLPDYVGKHLVSRQLNGINQEGYITVPEINNTSPTPFAPRNTYYDEILTGTMVRWNYTDAASIGDRCAVSGNGEYGAVGWGLNNTRISFYDNASSTPVWEYTVPNNYQVNFVSLNYSGNLIAAGAAQNVYVFNSSSNVPIFNFDLTTLGGAPTAGPVALAQNEDFLVATSTLTDSSIILGFNTSSTTPVWSAKLIDPAGGSGNILGVNLSGNDSMMIVNTYGAFWVMETFTGNIIYQGVINPISSTSGTQATQGINYDGSIIATINYYGYVRVFQRSGNNYNLLWEDQEPPGTYYNWANCVDVSDDGNYIAVGTLIFITLSDYNGTVKLYKTSEGGTPSWIFDNCGDNVTSVDFNGPANVLAAASWGALDNSTPDLYIFKTWEGNTPIFTVSTAGSFFDGKISFDGSTILTSGKAVHARTFGNGGLAYNISVDTSDTNIPVELTSFTANADGGNVTLNWSTATETNNKGFQIERKTIHGQFRNVAFVAGYGTTTQPQHYSYVDKEVISGKYIYRLRQVDFDGTFEYSNQAEVDVESPSVYSLEQNYPNPFNPSTQIKFGLATDSRVTLKVFDVLGQEVAVLLNENIAAGEHSVNFDASHLNSGVYLYKIEATGTDGSSFTLVKKMILTK
jgi:hypothetical protein